MISKEGSLRMTRERNLDIARRKLSSQDTPSEIINMEVLTQADKQKLKGFLSEAVASLQTIADEREHYNDIASRIEKDMGINKKVFKKTAELVSKGTLEEVKQLHEDADDLYSQVSTVV